ncbi:hypothetical protein APED_32355 [Acanthopleuribacter pedis]
MNITFFRIPTQDDGRESEALNTFLAARWIVSISDLPRQKREMVAKGWGMSW